MEWPGCIKFLSLKANHKAALTDTGAGMRIINWLTEQNRPRCGLGITPFDVVIWFLIKLRVIQWGKASFQQMVLKTTGNSCGKKNEPWLTSHHI